MTSLAGPHDTKAPLGLTGLRPSFWVGAARCIDAARLELVRLYDEATDAQRSEGLNDGWEQIHVSLCELARQCADLRLDRVTTFSNDPALISDDVRQAEHTAVEPASTVVLPLTAGNADHLDGGPYNRTPPGMLKAVAQRLDAVGTEIVMYGAASEPERSEVGDRIRIHLRELQVRYAHTALEGEAGQPSPASHSDASVGTEDVDVDDRLGTLHAALSVSDLGIPSRMMVELAPVDGPRTFDVQDDLARMVCCRSAAALAIRLRWLVVASGTLGSAAPVLVIFAVHWAGGGLGQFALAYQFPAWLEVWYCVGWWLGTCAMLLCYASMQREIAWMALRQFSTLWVITMTAVFVAAFVSLQEFGVHRSTWVVLPVYIGCALFFPMIAMGDALPPKLRLHILRFFGPVGLGATATVAVVLRLPTAEDTPGEFVWKVMGTDTVTNLQMLTYSASVLAVLLAKGVLRAWVFPSKLAFIQTSLDVSECVSGAVPEARAAVRSGSANVAPHPLDPSELG